MEEIITLIKDLGVPVGMCIYLLWFQKNTIEMLKNSIDNLTEMIHELKLRIELNEKKE